MADDQNGGQRQSSDSNTSTTSTNTNVNNINASTYPSYLAWQQYWQYYYTYNFHYYTSYYYNLLQQQSNQSNSHYVNNSVDNGAQRGARWPEVHQQPANAGNIGPVHRQVIAEVPQTTYEYTIAPLRKRVFAEFIDFVFLFFLKFVTFSVIFKNIDHLSQIEYILVLDETTSFKEIEEVLFQALLYRFLVFLYETLFLAFPIFCYYGGSTPGKYMMGITVITYPGLLPVTQGQYVRHYLGTAPRRMHFINSCARSFLKNFMITFFFPIMLSAMFVRDFRTPYDLVSSSVVVNAHPKKHVHHTIT